MFTDDLTIMNQHRRYFDAQEIPGCPRQILLDNICTCLHQWRQAGEQLVVFIDANENTTNGPFHNMFVSPDLGMREAVVHRHPDPRWQHTATYHKGDSLGKFAIDGMYATPDRPFNVTSWLQFMPHLGNHHFKVLDINSEALMGDSLLKIVCPAARHLSCSIPSAVAEYNKCLKTHMDCHQIRPHLHHLYSTWNGNFTPLQQQHLETLDRVRAEGMLCAKKEESEIGTGQRGFLSGS
jgi:hypothetical protein